LWLATGDERGMTFSPLFDVLLLKNALEAVNMLNGGSADFKIAAIVWEH